MSNKMMGYFRNLNFALGCLAIILNGEFAFGQAYSGQTIMAFRIDQSTYSSIGNTEGYLLESELLRRVEQLYGYKFETVEGLPFKRLVLGFEHSKSAIAVGFCLQNESYEYLKKISGHQSYPLISATLYRYQGFRIYTRKTDPIINSLEKLAFKKVGVVRGMALPARLSDFEAKLKNKIKIETVDSEKQNILKLKLGRIDAFISNAAETALHAENNRYSAEDFHSSTEIERINCGVIFHQSNDGARLLSAFNVAISDMHLDGSYCKIMKGSVISTVSCFEKK